MKAKRESNRTEHITARVSVAQMAFLDGLAGDRRVRKRNEALCMCLDVCMGLVGGVEAVVEGSKRVRIMRAMGECDGHGN
jgi:hypothetical protein